ncbi:MULTISPECIES: SAM-dependent methyltransferase [unclassified Nonomuraea]|uniref:SAM-dependent methyltransferase n=1 Tax=Nonomuraea sp. NPDC003804 TaxID=3154547 RepID=UPI0033B9D398
MTDSARDRLDRIDSSVPHPARVWDYWLGGKDNYEADRAVGDEILKVMPDLVVVARADRQFLGRAVRHLVDAGIRQFLDVGTGVPTADNTHQVAQRAAPESRIVYVDNDPIVLAHARALLYSTPEGATDYLDADLRDPETILRGAAKTLDFSRPIALMVLGVLEFLPDDEQVRAALSTLFDAMPAGSYLVVSHSVHSPSMDEAAARWNASGATEIRLRTPEHLRTLFDGMELVAPGVVSLPRWHPDAATEYTDREVHQYGGLGRKR